MAVNSLTFRGPGTVSMKRQRYSNPLHALAVARHFREVGSAAPQMQIFFCESPRLRDEASGAYGLEGQDEVLDELLVTSRKATA